MFDALFEVWVYSTMFTCFTLPFVILFEDIRADIKEPSSKWENDWDD